MRSVIKFGLALVLVGVLASRVSAQFGGAGNLLANKSVQEELKVNDDQKQKLDPVAQKLREKMQEKMQELGVTPDNFRDKQADIQKVGAEIRREAHKAVADILSKEQLARYKQIELQQLGARAFGEAEVATTLKLSDEQKKAVKELLEEHQKAMFQVFQDNQGDFAKMREGIVRLNKETGGKITGKLTEEQKKAWAELAGKPFEIRLEPRRPRQSN
jgi:hypothetical protein